MDRDFLIKELQDRTDDSCIEQYILENWQKCSYIRNNELITGVKFSENIFIFLEEIGELLYELDNINQLQPLSILGLEEEIADNWICLDICLGYLGVDTVTLNSYKTISTTHPTKCLLQLHKVISKYLRRKCCTNDLLEYLRFIPNALEQIEEAYNTDHSVICNIMAIKVEQFQAKCISSK